ncbi:MAG: histidine kinase [Acidobacteriota bacterium]
MKVSSRNKSPWLELAVIFFAWTLYGLFFASQAYISEAHFGRNASWQRALGIWMTCAYSWALVTPPILWLARRLQFNRQTWRRSLLIHLLAATFFSTLVLLLYSILRYLFFTSDNAPSLMRSFRNLLIIEFHASLLIYSAIVGIYYGLNYYREYKRRELAAAQLANQLSQAQLDALRKQLHPHFLFNTLNTVAILMEEDTKAAREILVRLSDLLRVTLDKNKAHEVALKQELDFLQSYLEIEQMRFQDRLRVHLEIDPKTLDARVPDLILQPIVENAIRHGIAPRALPGIVEIRSAQINGDLCLEVRDNGKGFDNELSMDKGLGLANTKARLEQLYGDRHRFEIANLDEGGVRVNITIPFHTQAMTVNGKESSR